MHPLFLRGGFLKLNNTIVKNMIILLFGIKLLIYYVAVEVSIFIVISFILTMLIFLGAMYICTHDDGKRRVLGFGLVYLFFSVIMFIDVIYYNYFNQVASVNQLLQIKNISGSEESVKAAVPILSIFILADIPLVWYLAKKTKGFYAKKPISRRRKYTIFSVMLVFIVIISTNPFHWPSISSVNSTEVITTHVKDLFESTIGKVLYGSSSLSEIMEMENISNEAMESIVEDITDNSNLDANKYASIGKGKNLIIIQIESIQNFVIGETYNGQEITPNLNQLIGGDTLYFDHYYSSMGKGNTADADFSTITSLYSVIEGASYDLYYENDYIGLPRLLKNSGYSTNASIGMSKDFYNRDTAYANLGYDCFYSSDTFDMNEISGMGLTDRSMFAQMADNLEKTKTPFYSFILTLTNHYPYVLDESLISLKLKEVDVDSQFGNYLQAVNYTDQAIGEFIDQLKDKGLYEDSIIVLYGDHHGLNYIDDDNYEKMTEYLGYAYDYDSMLNVPLLIHIPETDINETIATVGGQVDFLPTIANIMDLDLSESVILGQDIINAEEGFVATVAYMLQGSFIKDNVLYVIGRDGTFDSGRAIDLNTKEAISIDGLLEYSQKASAVTELSKYLLEHNETIYRNLTASSIDQLKKNNNREKE